MIIRTDGMEIINVTVSGICKYDTVGIYKEKFNYLLSVGDSIATNWESIEEASHDILSDLFNYAWKELNHNFNEFDVTWFINKEYPCTVHFAELEDLFNYFVNRGF